MRRDTSKRTSAVRGEGAFRILSIANNSDLMHLRLKDLKGSGEDGAVPVASLIPWNVVVHRHFGQKVVPPQFDVGCRAMSRFIEGQIREWKLEKNAPWLGKFSIRHSTKLSNDAPKKLAGHWTGHKDADLARPFRLLCMPTKRKLCERFSVSMMS